LDFFGRWRVFVYYVNHLFVFEFLKYYLMKMKKKNILQKIAVREFVSSIKQFKNRPDQLESFFRPYLKQPEKEEKNDTDIWFAKLPQWE